ncbi:porin family protein [Nonlabens sp. Asnod3-A02]|uniref:porin family protein n=1 Tax=Nonlabens sp. Asnod3-A02 TaxID=3160579 RepID=UPI003866F84A
MRLFLLVLLFLTAFTVVKAQDVKRSENAIPTVVDSLYREDQFYVALSFNLINNEPDSFSQNGFSGGLSLGFIRDMPVNKRRNMAIGVGLGFSTNSYNSNLFIGEDASGATVFSIVEDEDSVDRNRFYTNLIEVPIQFRWRTSTATNTTFWRIYSGVKLSYMFTHRASFKDDVSSVKKTSIPELNRFRYAATLTLGHGSFNAFVQYDLNTLFDDNAVIGTERVNLQPIKFGIEFYLL